VTVAEVMGDAYPELVERQGHIQEVIRSEEERFSETLEKGLGLLEGAISQMKRHKQKVLSGELAFRLYDTYGFPLDLTEDILRGEGISVDNAGFERLMEEQRSRAREAREVSQSDFKVQLDRPVRFIGYDRMEAESTVLALYADGQGRQEVGEGSQIDLITAETPFYGESGGQVGDRGVVETARGDRMEVVDTQHPTPQLTVHRGRVVKGRISVGDKVHLAVDPRYRRRTALNHSATHILHSVLREELGGDVRQAGSLVAAERLRFDFNHTGAIADEKLADIEQRVNERIRLDADVRIEETSYDEAVRKGALAFFGDKYGDTVRVVKIGDFSSELCGGTHVHRSGEIGIFKLQAEGGVAAGVRRVEAVTGEGALDLIRAYEQRLKEIGALLRSGADDTVERVKKLLQQQKELEREIETLRGQQGKNQLPELLAKKQQVNGASVVVSKVDNLDGNQLRELADQLKEKIGSGFVFLVSAGDSNVSMVASVTKDLTSRYHAGNIVKQVAPIVGGGGGGRPDFAQAGGKEPAKVDEAVERVWQIVKSTNT